MFRVISSVFGSFFIVLLEVIWFINGCRNMCLGLWNMVGWVVMFDLFYGERDERGFIFWWCLVFKVVVIWGGVGVYVSVWNLLDGGLG